MSKKLSDSQILDAWHVNAAPWIKAIENNEIESRRLVTNQAIIKAITDISPDEVLDIGCGEGWLAGELLQRGIKVFGADAVPALIEKARLFKGGEFDVCTYEDLSSYEFNRKFACLVCNFSLIGKESTENVIEAAVNLLKPDGRLLIQTLHPVTACGGQPYEDGWREGSWAGFSSDFTTPAPWYFRKTETWEKLFEDKGLLIKNIHEPLHPVSGKPASIIFDLSLA